MIVWEFMCVWPFFFLKTIAFQKFWHVGGGGDSLPWFSGPRCPDSVLSAASRFDDLHTTLNKDYWGYDVGGELENGFVKSPAAVESLRYVV